MEIRGTYRITSTSYSHTTGQAHINLEQIDFKKEVDPFVTYNFGPSKDLSITINEKAKFDQLLPGEEFEVTLRRKQTL